jgi:hypothetical protein
MHDVIQDLHHIPYFHIQSQLFPNLSASSFPYGFPHLHNTTGNAPSVLGWFIGSFNDEDLFMVVDDHTHTRQGIVWIFSFHHGSPDNGNTI